MKNLIKNKKIIIIAFIIVLIILFFVLIKVLGGSKSVHGNRCSDNKNYEISSKVKKKKKSELEKIDNVKKVKIYTQLCTVKVMINLKEDTDIEKVKSATSEMLKAFKKKDLKYYDFSLYVTSDNKDSETYPINVTKHNTRDDFAW